MMVMGSGLTAGCMTARGNCTRVMHNCFAVKGNCTTVMYVLLMDHILRLILFSRLLVEVTACHFRFSVSASKMVLVLASFSSLFTIMSFL